MLPQRLVTLVMIPLHRRLLDRTIHPFHLPIRPRMVQLRQPVLDAVGSTHAVKGMPEGVSITLAMRELNAVIRQNSMDMIRHHLDEPPEKGCRYTAFGPLMQFGIGKLRGAVNGYKEIEFTCLGMYFGNVEVKVAYRVLFEALLLRLVAQLGKTTDAVTLEAAMQRRAGQVWDRGLKRIEAIIKRQQRMFTKGDYKGFFFQRKRGRAGFFGPHRRIVGKGASAPFGNGFRIDAMVPSQVGYAVMAVLDGSSDGLRRCGAAVEKLSHSVSRLSW